MGINSIKCNKDAGPGRTCFGGKSERANSDFDSTKKDVISTTGLLALAYLTVGCVERYDVKIESHAKHDHPLTMGTIRKENEFYWIQREDDDNSIKPGQLLALYKETDDPTPSNVCGMINDGPRPFDDAQSYIVRCIKPVEWDDLKVGDRVAIYLENPE